METLKYENHFLSFSRGQFHPGTTMAMHHLETIIRQVPSPKQIVINVTHSNINNFDIFHVQKQAYALIMKSYQVDK